MSHFWLLLPCESLCFIFIGLTFIPIATLPDGPEEASGHSSFAHSQPCGFGQGCHSLQRPFQWPSQSLEWATHCSRLKPQTFPDWHYCLKLFTDLLPYLKFSFCMSSKQQAESRSPHVVYLLMPSFQICVMDGVNILRFCGFLESVALCFTKHWDKSHETRDKLNGLAHSCSDFSWPSSLEGLARADSLLRLR